MKKRVNLTIDQEVWEYMQELAQREKMSVSQLITREYFERMKREKEDENKEE